MKHLGTIAHLFPGHGGYAPGALHGLASRWPRIPSTVEVVDAVGEALGEPPIGPLLLRESAPSAEELFATSPKSLPIAGYTIGVAIHEVLSAQGIVPSLLLGHSFGEITALTCAGAFSVADGARILHARNQVLEGLGSTNAAMLALGLPARRAEALTALIGDPFLRPACDNAPDRTVISGPADSVDLARRIATTLGVSATPLPIPGAFHGPMMAPAVHPFEEAIAEVRRRPLTLPVQSPIEGRRFADDEPLAPLLARHLIRPVRFSSALREAYGTGIRVFVECGGGDGLSRMALRTLPPRVMTLPTARTARSASADMADALRQLSGETKEAPQEHIAKTAPDAPAPDAPAPAAPAPADSPPPAEAAAAPRDRDQVMEELRGLYAGALGYPAEVFTEDAEFEADLGIDSVKQTELLGEVLERFSIPADRAGAEFPVFGLLVDFVVGAEGGGGE